MNFPGEQTTIGDVLAKYGGEVKTGPFGTLLKASEYTASGVPVISVGEIGNGEIRIHDRTPFVGDAVISRLPEYLLRKGDIVFARKGSVERSALVGAEQVGWFLGSDGIRLRLSEEVCSKYVRYWISSEDTKSWLHQNSTGSTMASLNQATIKRLPITLPPLPEQREIAGVLGALDDKIEANRKAAACLEEMARALYRSWFVTFDPVHAKSQNRPPAHMPPTTAALFPDSFGENGLPEGWVAGTVGELLTLQRGFDLPKKERTDGAFPVLAAGGHHGTNKEFKVRGPGVTTGRSGVIGEVFLVLDDFWPLNTSLWVKDFIRCSPYFAYFLLQTLDLKALNSGSAVPSLNRNNVHNLSVDLPPERLIAAFDELAGPMFERVRHITTENQTLATLRDTLLPRLMSGTLRVKAAEAEVEAVV